MQQQQRGLFGITRLAIEDLVSPTVTVRYRVTGSAAIDSETLPSRAIAARAAAKNARHIGRSLVGGWRMVAQSPNLRSIISRRDNHLLIGYIISKFGRVRLSRISDLQAFVAVVEKASLTSAAHQLGRSLQSVSRSLAAIEQDVGVELIRRTTRRSNPTEAGLAYYQRLKTALEDIEEAKLQVSHRRLEPSGLLRISGPTGFAALHLVPATAAFLELHPKIEVEVSTYDRYVDLVEDNLDLAVHIGPLPDSAAKAKRLADLRRVFFASPGYFAKYGRPKRPEDLSKHQCIVRTARVGADIWPFTVDGKVKTIKVTGRFRANGASVINEAATHGLGIAIAPLWHIRPLIDRGLVELALARFSPPPIPVHATWSGTRVLPAKTRMFVDFLGQRLKAERL
jgi:DNA-binding transcriptional LysR family regulator